MLLTIYLHPLSLHRHATVLLRSLLSNSSYTVASQQRRQPRLRIPILPLDIVPPLTIAPPVSPVPTGSITPPPVREQPVLRVVFPGVVVDCTLHLLKVSCCPRTNTETRRLLPVPRHSASYMAKEDRSQRRCRPRNIRGQRFGVFAHTNTAQASPNLQQTLKRSQYMQTHLHTTATPNPKFGGAGAAAAGVDIVTATKDAVAAGAADG
jgi:hypothetical protein